MSWNPNEKDPWGRKNNNPPDLDDAIEQLRKMFFSGNSGKSSGGGGSPFKFGFKFFSYLLLGAVTLYLFLGVRIINEADREVVFTLGKYNRVLGPGLQFHFPVVEEIYASENISKIRTFVLPTNMLTKDENIVDVELNVQYTISDLMNYSLNVEDPEITIRQAAESALRHVVGENLMDDLLTSGAAAISSGILLRLDEYLAIYDAGISVQQVNIEQRQPPAEVIDSFRDVVAAREDKETLRNEAQKYALSIVPVARGDAQRQLQDAEGYKQKVIAIAEGESQRFEALLTEYQKAPEVTRERLYLDALEEVYSSSTKVMIDVEGGNNLLYLPIDQIMKKAEEDDE
ncbi:MAG: FtsH protease activity modulator HflK [SAR86 cluster bacterium]|uniref:Protein HflK n=1 Tax=SAR86 cluster bacterium TaxID=2030880 RepID=A0A520MXP3_9GAMM|nr:MAG: FtsH protease activity modulator HflK [SAR86 cluster bacterium]|tara:strand:+ start:123 stop:1154 length:1032 start_codon:yes stop_codon:yes gene_type:complete